MIRNRIDHSEGWAEDQDEDNRLRRFRGVHKDHLSGYVAMFELAFNHDQITPALLQRMCGV
jgi:transposase-like protein